MIKYIPIHAIMNQIAKVVKDDEDEIQLISWANDIFRTSELPFRYTLKYALLDVINHKAKLPDGVHRILDVLHSNNYPDQTVQTILRDYGDYRLIVTQQIFFSSAYYQSFRPAKYKGQNREAFIDEDVYCRQKQCEIGFSVDATLSCLTVDVPDGELYIEYFSTVTDEGVILIPDDADLIRGLALYAEAQYWRNKAYSHEDMANKFYMDNLQMSTTLLTKFKGKQLLRAINVDGHRQHVFGRNKINYTSNHRQRNYFK